MDSAPVPFTVGRAVCEGTQRLRAADVGDPRATARRLLCLTLGLDLAGLVRDRDEIVPEGALAHYRDFVERRIRGETPARLVGEREFWSLPFALSRDTLEPRPDTETLVEAVLSRFLPSDDKTSRMIADFGTGTGCILLALLRERPACRGIGIDIARGAVETGRQNAARLGLDARARFTVGDWRDPDPMCASLSGNPIDVLVSNPPYISRSDLATLPAEVRDWDPLLALDGGEDGLDAYRALTSLAARLLRQGGGIALEIGAGQGAAVSDLLDAAGFERIEGAHDLTGTLRVIHAVRR